MNIKHLAPFLLITCLLSTDASALPISGAESNLGTDCNDNGIPDSTDIADGTSDDCNNDGIPDECPVCPPLDVVFVMDTSGSMNDDARALCSSIGDIISTLNSQGIVVNAEIWGITKTDFSCLTDYVENALGDAVPGSPPPGEEFLDDNEDWGPATAIVADRYPWTPGAVRVIIPLSDEAPEDGDRCDEEDTATIQNAISIANSNGVVVSPVAAGGSDQCVIDFMVQLADATGGTNVVSNNPSKDLAAAVLGLLLDACSDANDCNKNGIPDECDPDGDNNGIPDDCEGLNDLDCTETNRYETLTPNDTLTVISSNHNPNVEQGYLRVVAVNEGLDPVSFDHLIGNVTVIDGFESIDYGINAVDYRAAVDPGTATDVDGDGIRDLNGIEYEHTAGKLMVPRFIGQTDINKSDLLLIGLSGGRKFDTTIDFIVANDNEVLFSTEYTFRCWDKVTLSSISQVFGDAFLRFNSDHDEQEDLGGTETGWFWMDGGIANSTAATIPDPAFYAVYIERLFHFSAADLPFEACTQSGHLLPDALFGDNEEVAGEAPQDCDVHIPRRQPGSLLLYPEFDNFPGAHTVITVTNTSPDESIKAHFIYVGRYGI